MMHRREPPTIATWMLEHLTPEERDEALAGDLLEQYRAGRSAGWYRRQVFGAIALEWARGIWRRRAAVFYAAIWSLLSPAWELLYLRHFRNGRLDDLMWRLPFPWSTVCAIALGAAECMLFIWLGVLVYVMLCWIAVGNLHLRRFGRAFLSSFLAYMLAGASEVAVAFSLESHFQGPGVDWRTLTFTGVLTHFTVRAALGYVPFIVGLAGALWSLAPNPKRPAKVAA